MKSKFMQFETEAIIVILPLRGLFIIDDKGVLRQITMNDLPVGRSVDETLRLVQAFQYTDKHGEGMVQSHHITHSQIL